MNWISEHPYLTGSLVLGGIVLLFVLRGSGSGSQGTQVVNSGPSDSLQAMQLQSAASVQNTNTAATVAISQYNAAVASKQIDANTEVQKDYLAQQVALQSIYSNQAVSQYHDDTSLKLAQAQVGGQVQLAQIGADKDERIAGIQADVSKSNAVAALAAQRDIDAAATAQKQIEGTTAITLNQSNNDTAIRINQDTIKGNLDYTQLYNQGQVDLATIDAGVKNNYINAQKDLYSQELTNEHDANQNAYQYKQSVSDQILSFLKGGGFNKGGEGGTNQVSISNVLLGGNGYAPPTQNSGFSFGVSIPGVGSVGAGASL